MLVDFLPGVLLAREIPHSVLSGLATGAYTLHGGVVRHAAGSVAGGQIVAHLLPTTVPQLSFAPLLTPIPSIANTYQLFKLDHISQQILQVVTGTMSLAGLHLLVSATGFRGIQERLGQMEAALEQIHTKVQAIKTLLEQQERAALRRALTDLLTIDQVESAANRQAMLHQARQTLGDIAQRYAELLSTSAERDLALPYEEYYCLSALAHIRCLAELGEYGLATTTLQSMHETWQTQTRRIAREYLIGEHPERFLMSDFTEDIPIAALVQALDFAHETQHGYAWLDTLRSKMRPWYEDSSPWIWVCGWSSRDEERRIQRTVVLPALHKLVARNVTLEGYIAQYDLLAQHRLTPAAFERRLAQVPQDDSQEGFLILLPEPARESWATRQHLPAPTAAAPDPLLEHLLATAVARPALPLQPDFSVTIAETTLQYVLARYVTHNFAAVELVNIDEKYLGGKLRGQVRGRNIQLDMHPGVAEVRIEVDGALTTSAWGNKLTNWAGLVVLSIQAGFTVNASRQVCLDLAGGAARIVEPEWLITWAQFLIQPVLNAIPPVPLFPILASFPLTDARNSVVEMFALKVTGIEIGEHEVRLTLGLEHGDVTSHPALPEHQRATQQKGPQR